MFFPAIPDKATLVGLISMVYSSCSNLITGLAQFLYIPVLLDSKIMTIAFRFELVIMLHFFILLTEQIKSFHQS